MADLQTLLSYFLNDLYAGTVGVSNPITSFQASAAGSFKWSGRSILTSPADGVVEATNAAGTGFTRLILGTNDGTANGMAVKLNSGVAEFWTGDGTSARVDVVGKNLTGTGTLTVSGALTLVSAVTTYNNVATAGQGVNVVRAQATVGPVTNGGTASIAAFSVGASDGIFQVSADVSVTTSSNHTFSIDCVYTDAASNARTMLMPMEQLLTGNFISGALITNTLGVGAYASATMQIRAKASTTITLRTSAGGTFTGVVYTTSASIVQVG